MMNRINQIVFTLIAITAAGACTAGNATPADSPERDVITVEPSVILEQPLDNALGNSPEDFEALLGEYLALNQRLEDVAYKILSANTSECPETRRDIGIKIHTIHDYPSELQMFARQFMDLDTHPSIRVISDSSPGANAGLKVGDKVTAIGSQTIMSGEVGARIYKAASRQEYELSQAKIKIRRGDELIDYNLAPRSICGYPAQLFYSEVINAHTNGEEIWVTSELLRQVKSDTSLALIFAHELAHASQGHIYKEPTAALELEADRLSLEYLARAGYDPDEAVRLWQLNPLNHKEHESETHPSPNERLKILQQVLADL